jgi:para-nitrobenzyl esterase
MSGGGLSDLRPGVMLDTAQLANKNMMDYFEKATLDEMRALTFDELLKMSGDYTAATGKRVMWGPVIDGYLLTGTFTNVARAGGIADIPYMIGFTANDMIDMTKAVSDFCALRAEQSSKPSYAYLFERPLPGDTSGAFHSSDLWYVFHSLRHSWRPFTAGDDELSIRIVDFWTNFAKYGNPNGSEAGIWTPYTARKPEFMVFNIDGDKASCTMSDKPEFKGGGFPR